MAAEILLRRFRIDVGHAKGLPGDRDSSEEIYAATFFSLNTGSPAPVNHRGFALMQPLEKWQRACNLASVLTKLAADHFKNERLAAHTKYRIDAGFSHWGNLNRQLAKRG
jgi:hypothetical protein